MTAQPASTSYDASTQGAEGAPVVHSTSAPMETAPLASDCVMKPCYCQCCRDGIAAPHEYHLERRQMPTWDYEVMSCGGEWVPESRDYGPPDVNMFVIRNLRMRE